MEVQRYLDGLDYPVNKRSLIAYAQRKGAPEGVIESLDSVTDRSFSSPTDLMKEIGGIG